MPMRVVRQPWSKWRENLRYRLLPEEGRGGQGAREQEGRQCGAGQVMSADLIFDFINCFLFRARSHPQLRPRPPINYSELEDDHEDDAFLYFTPCGELKPDGCSQVAPVIFMCGMFSNSYF